MGQKAAGWVVVTGGDEHAMTWLNDTPTDLGMLGTRSRATAINDAGKVAGKAYINSPYEGWSAFFYDGVAMELLSGFPSGVSSSEVEDMNNSDQMVGSFYVMGDSRQYGFIHSGGVMTELPTIDGSYSNISPRAINEDGDIVGEINKGGVGGGNHAFFYDGATMKDLGTLGGGNCAIAYDVNNLDQVVGWSNGAPGNGWPYGHAWIYDDVNGMRDLNTLIDPSSEWELTYAYGINDAGQIVGVGKRNGSNQDRAILLSQFVPEPSTLILFISSVVVLAHRRRRIQLGR